MYRVRGPSVIVKDHESINQALKRFKKKVNDSGRLDVVRKKEYYETPTQRRVRERGEAIFRYKRKIGKEEDLRAKF